MDEGGFVRARLPVLAVALLLFLPVPRLSAEPIGSHFEVTPFGGYTIFDSALQPTGSPLRDAVYAGARIGWFARRWWGVEAALGMTPTAEERTGGTDVNFTHASGSLLLTPWQGRSGGPFLMAGFGGTQLKPQGGESFNMGNLELGAGVRLWLTDMVGIRLEARNLHWLPNNDLFTSKDNLVVGGGITFALGATPRDTDGDGVPDRRDTCPGTPKGARVDANGCPLDSDGDKVFDGLDRCENTPQGCTVDANGCPTDADGDGVCDGVDTCPDTPKGATVNATGCPSDSDGDAVFDGIDQCANTPKGCTVNATGCPSDGDGDGVCDGLDKCPDTTPGLQVDATGCPIELVERETELLDTGMIRLQDVNFETAKANILPESHATLDVVGQVLTKWPELRIEVGGHCDSRGSDAYNLRLSDMRADSVLAYLLRKFPNLKREQFTARGYGESRPLVPNTNPLNMAKNRRVEFVVQNKDVLRREVERRRLLRQGETSAPADTTITPTPSPPDTTRR
jgi:outer membrane protein OmpA-like peptidoglycan-associated protein